MDSFEEMMKELDRDERFKAAIAAINALLIAKDVYSSDEFESYMKEAMRPRLERQRNNIEEV